MWLVVCVLLVAGVIAGQLVYARLIAPAAPLNFDEAAHSLPAYYMLRDVRAADARAFWGDVHIQTLWPPMFSIMQAPFLAILGRSDNTARLFAYLMLVAGTLLTCALAWEIDPDRAPLAALAAGMIALSAPGWLFAGSWAMQETPVAFMLALVFWCYARALNRGGMVWHAATGVALFALFLTKYNYAAFALAAILAVDLGLRVGRFWRAPRGSRTRALRISTLLALILPFAAGLLLWFFGGTDVVPTATKWRDFAFFVTNENSGYDFWSAQNLFFYVRAAADWLMPHPVAFGLALLGAVWALLRLPRAMIRLLGLFFALGFVLATLHPLKSERYITPIFPSLWLLTGFGLAALLARWRMRGRAGAMGVCIALAAAALVWRLPARQPVWAGGVADGLRASAAKIVDWQDGAKPVLIIGTFGELSPPLFEWRLRPLTPFHHNDAVQYDAPPVDGPDDIARVQRWLDEHPGAQVSLIAIDADSPLYNTDDMQHKNLWKQEIVRRFSEVRGYRQVDSARYPASGITVSYWLRE